MKTISQPPPICTCDAPDGGPVRLEDLPECETNSHVDDNYWSIEYGKDFFRCKKCGVLVYDGDDLDDE